MTCGCKGNSNGNGNGNGISYSEYYKRSLLAKKGIAELERLAYETCKPELLFDDDDIPQIAARISHLAQLPTYTGLLALGVAFADIETPSLAYSVSVYLNVPYPAIVEMIARDRAEHVRNAIAENLEEFLMGFSYEQFLKALSNTESP